MDKEHPIHPDLSCEDDPETIAFWTYYMQADTHKNEDPTDPALAKAFRDISSGSYPAHESLIPPCCCRK